MMFSWRILHPIPNATHPTYRVVLHKKRHSISIEYYETVNPRQPKFPIEVVISNLKSTIFIFEPLNCASILSNCFIVVWTFNIHYRIILFPCNKKAQVLGCSLSFRSLPIRYDWFTQQTLNCLAVLITLNTQRKIMTSDNIPLFCLWSKII